MHTTYHRSMNVHPLFLLVTQCAQVCEVSTGRVLNQLQNGHLSNVCSLAWNPDLDELYSGGSDGQIMTWAPDLQESLHGIWLPRVPGP